MKTTAAGYTEKKINGKTVGFKFGTNAFSLFCEMHGLEMHEMDKALGGIAGVRDLIYCAARAAALSAGREVWFNEYVIGDWLDEAPQEDYDDILKAMNNAKVMGQGVQAKEKKS